MQTKQERFAALGGRSILEKVSKVFYDKIYKHPLLGQFFQHIDQTHIESQQVNFMQGALGGSVVYSGRLVPGAHMHMYITEEIYKLRQDILIQSLNEVRAQPELIERWLRVENAFKGSVVKQALTDCKKRYNSDTIQVFS